MKGRNDSTESRLMGLSAASQPAFTDDSAPTLNSPSPLNGQDDETEVQTQRWQRIRAVFEEALNSEPDERASFLERACGSDATLIADVQKLLASHELVGSFLENPPVADLDSTEVEAAEPQVPVIPREIGPYQVLHEIGSGGKGTVYLASRSDDHDQELQAVIVSRPRPDSQQVLEGLYEEWKMPVRSEDVEKPRAVDQGTTDEGLCYLVVDDAEGILSFSFQRIGAMLLEMGDLQGALGQLQKAQQILERLAAADSPDPWAASNLARSYWDLGVLFKNLALNAGSSVDESIGNWREARSWLQKSLDLSLRIPVRDRFNNTASEIIEQLKSEISGCDSVLEKSALSSKAAGQS